MEKNKQESFEQFANMASEALNDLMVKALELSEELAKKEDAKLTKKEKDFMKATALAGVQLMLGMTIFGKKNKKSEEEQK